MLSHVSWRLVLFIAAVLRTAVAPAEAGGIWCSEPALGGLLGHAGFSATSCLAHEASCQSPP